MADQNQTQIVLPGTDQRISTIQLRQFVQQAGPNGIDETRFLELMVVEGFLSLEALPHFVEDAHRERVALGEHAVNRGVFSAEDRTRLRARQYNMRTVDLSMEELDEDVARLVPLDDARRLGALPYARNGDGRVIVAIYEPGDGALRQQLTEMVGGDVEFRVTSENDLLNAIAALSPSEEDAISEALQVTRDQGSQVDTNIRVNTSRGAVTELVDRIILRAHDEGVSDVHIESLESGALIRFRTDGVMTEIERIPHALRDQVISRIKVMAALNIAEHRKPQDGRTTINAGRTEIDLRIAIAPTAHGEEVVMRLLNPLTSRMTLTDLGFGNDNLERYRQAVAKPWGTIIVTGPTGSGKSTTLYASLNMLNDPSRKIVTIEDPVEQRIAGISQSQVNEAIDYTFSIALRSILRRDPDVIMIGEVRDLETAEIAIRSALTGHLVLTSLHTNDAVSAITRLVEMGVERFLIGGALDLIVAQRLARRVCPNCREPAKVDKALLRGIYAPGWALERLAAGDAVIYQAREGGCPRCKGRGYYGRLGVHEVLALTPDMKRAITGGGSAEDILQMAMADGMKSMREDCFAKVFSGHTTLDELARVIT